MPTEKDKEFWAALHTVLKDAMDTLPSSIAPEVIPFPYEGEEWKEQAQIDEAEENTWMEAEDLIRHYCEHHEWPKKAKGEVCYFIEERIKWARIFTRWMLIPYSKTGNVFFRRPKESGYELLEWLLIDVYAKKSPPPPPSYITFMGPDGKRTMTTHAEKDDIEPS